MTPLLFGLTLLACISPLLTFAYLWQLKEWRLDRLREHLRAEGRVRQVMGILRPAVLLIYAALLVLQGIEVTLIITTTLGFLAILTLLQFLLHRQPCPVWTSKACALVGMSLLVTIFLIFGLQISLEWLHILPFLIPIQPLFLAAALTLFWPLDHWMKRRIMQSAANARALYKDCTVIGITGSAGKTTTKELLVHLLKDHGACGTPSHVNTELGVAKWIQNTLKQKPVPETLIVEMGAYRRGEIKDLCSIAQPNLGIVTFVGQQHLALFKSTEALCKAKGELIEALPEDGMAFLNADNERCMSLKESAKCPVTTIGTGGHADIESYDVEETPTGIRFRIQETTYEVPLHGTHNVTNAMLAIAVAQHLGLEPAEIATKLRSFSPPAHTFNAREENGVALLDDTHNASPASFAAAIAWAVNQPAEHKILLTNGLIELGTEEHRIHAELGASAATVFERVIFLSPQRLSAFQDGYVNQIELLNKQTERVKSKSLLVCVGRMSLQTIRQMLPL